MKHLRGGVGVDGMSRKSSWGFRTDAFICLLLPLKHEHLLKHQHIFLPFSMSLLTQRYTLEYNFPLIKPGRILFLYFPTRSDLQLVVYRGCSRGANYSVQNRGYLNDVICQEMVIACYAIKYRNWSPTRKYQGLMRASEFHEIS